MSYSIIFETKIVRLSDGRILHLSLQGCNNDNAGRSRDDFSGKVYTVEEFKEKAEGFKKNSKPSKEEGAGWDLKIGSRYCTYYDYGEHLLRMLASRSVTWEELTENRRCYADVFTGVTVNTDTEVIDYSSAEWEKVAYDYFYGRKRGKVTQHHKYLYEEKEIIEALDKDAGHISFFIGKAV